MIPDNNEHIRNEGKKTSLSINNDLSTSITTRIQGLLDKLMPVLSVSSHLWSKGPSLFTPNQEPSVHHMDWAKRFISRIFLPITSVPLLNQNLSSRFSPVSFTWFDPVLWRHSKRPQTPVKRLQDTVDVGMTEMSPPLLDEDIFDLPMYNFGKDEDKESIISHLQSKIPSHHVLELPHQPDLMTRNRRLIQGIQPVRAIKRAFKPSIKRISAEPISISSHQWLQKDTLEDRQPTSPLNASAYRFEQRAILSPNTDAYQPFIHKDIPGESSSQTKGFSYPSTPIALPAFNLHSTPAHLDRTDMILKPADISMTDGESAPLISPSVQWSTDMKSDYELSESPEIALDTIMKGKATADSTLYTTASPQLPVNTVPTVASAATPAPHLQETAEISREQTMRPVETTFGNLSRITSRLLLNRNLGSRQVSLFQGLIGHIPSGLVAEAMAGDTVRSAETVEPGAGHGNINSLDISPGIELALAPVGRRSESTDATTQSTTTEGERTTQTEDEASSDIDTEALASEIYDILKRRLLVERERSQVTM